MSESVKDVLKKWQEMCMPKTRKIAPNLLAKQLVSVQPMAGATGQVFYIKFSYGDIRKKLYAFIQDVFLKGNFFNSLLENFEKGSDEEMQFIVTNLLTVKQQQKILDIYPDAKEFLVFHPGIELMDL